MDIVEELKQYTRNINKLNAAEKEAKEFQKQRDKAWREYYLLRDIVNDQAAKLGFDEEEELKPKKLKLGEKTYPNGKKPNVEIDLTK